LKDLPGTGKGGKKRPISRRYNESCDSVRG
jgi:hypothetical protein